MFKVSNLSKSFGGAAILRGVSLVANGGDRIGVAGANGSGKSTLLRIIAGEEPADAGAIDTSGVRLGYLRQGLAHAAGRPCAAVFPHAFAHQLAAA